MARPGPASPFPAGPASHPRLLPPPPEPRNVARPAGRLERLGSLSSQFMSIGARCGSSHCGILGEGKKTS